MLLQLAIDRPDHLSVVSHVAGLIDIVEAGTPLLKRFGISAISTLKELAPTIPVLADTKTVDGGALEAEMVFGAGASYLTVLSCAAAETHFAACHVAERLGARIVVDTLTDPEDVLHLGHLVSASFSYVLLHAPTDVRQAGAAGEIDYAGQVQRARSFGYRVAVAGGINVNNLRAVVDAGPDVVVVGTAITEASDPRGTTEWMVSQLPDRNRGWPWDAR